MPEWGVGTGNSISPVFNMKLLKENIKAKITRDKVNYTDSDRNNLDKLFPEEVSGFHGDVKQNRVRFKDKAEFPDRLPTSDLTPYPIDEDDFIGQFESKKNLYLTTAFAFNKAMERIEQLEAEVKKLKKR